MTTMLLEQIKKQSELIQQGYSPSIDLHNRSVLELLDIIDELLSDALDEGQTRDLAVEASAVISMVRVKMGFPASFYTSHNEFKQRQKLRLIK
jgi:hypothetical protein